MIEISNKVTLVNYAIPKHGFILSSLMASNTSGLLAAILQNAGFDPTIRDYNTVSSLRTILNPDQGRAGLLEQITDELDEDIQQGTKAIGFTLFSNGLDDIATVAEELKQRHGDNVLLAAGGPHVGIYGDLIFQRTDAFDVLVQGDGRIAIERIAEMGYKDGSVSDVPGAIYREKGTGTIRRTRELTKDDIVMTGQPSPIYDPEVYKAIGEKLMVTLIELGTGCPWGQCSPCTHPLLNPHLLERNIAEAIAEIDHLKKTYNTRFIRFAESVTPQHALEHVLQAHPDVMISMFGRTDTSYDFAALQKNVMAIFFGLESGNHGMLETYNKASDPAEYLRKAADNIARAKAAGISTISSMMIPGPFETDATMDDSYNLLVDIAPDCVPILAMGPLYGTPIYHTAKQLGAESGLILDPTFDYDTMMLELDLQKPPTEWVVPYKTVVNGEPQNPFAVTHEFKQRLAPHGMLPFPDEFVLMAAAYHNGLSQDQNERRQQIGQFVGGFYGNLMQGNFDELDKMVEQMNKNVEVE